jgi:adenylate cyclase
MFDLVVQGINAQDRWRRRLPVEAEIELGRTTKPWSVSWDDRISRRHVTLRLSGQKLLVSRVESATNPLFYEGEEVDKVELSAGQAFVIGQTTFTLSQSQALATQDIPNPISQKTFTHQFLKQVDYRDAERRLAVLGQLPDLVSSSGDDVTLYNRLVNVLFDGIRRAKAIAIVRVDSTSERIEVDYWDRRNFEEQDFHPSEKLVRQSISSGEPVLHIWNEKSAGSIQYTVDMQNDWAFMYPLGGNVCRNQGIYVAGNQSTMGTDSVQADIEGDIKFAELVGDTFANLREMNQLERRQASLRSFFSPIVMDVIGDQDLLTVLAPRECDVSVLFCDLRGFSATSEKMADQLQELLERVSQVLGIVTSNILLARGVIGDFHGDAAMGFWGWPLEQDDAAERACNATVAIARHLDEISKEVSHPLRDFQIGMGIATGRAVAGMIGTSDQVKVTAFGPVVNLAARLEGMTKLTRAPVLIDGETATALQQANSSHVVRRVATMRPVGIRRDIEVFQLVSAEPSTEGLSAENLEQYSDALASFECGDWGQARGLLASLPASDVVKDFLLNHIGQRDQPDEGWNGVIELAFK